MAYHVKNEPPESDVWYVDTGCSNHMCGSKYSFSYLTEGFRITVSFGDCSTVSVMGKETISDIFYIPDLKSNLLSAGQLQEKGYIITIQKGACKIYDPSKQLFPLLIENVQTCLMVRVNDPSWLWYFCYGHLSFGGLKILQQKNMVRGLLPIEVPSQVCKECVVSKQHRNQFS
ncbi:hypothetical protein ACOSQ4_021059 [Xanthoceras sorbifolium]